MATAIMNEPINGNHEISYDQFGHQLVHLLVTPERIESELKAILAEPVEGIVSRLPAEMLTAKYRFLLQDVKVTVQPADLPRLVMKQHITGQVSLSVRLLKLNLLGLKLRFTLRLGIHLEQRVRTCKPLVLHIDTRLREDSPIELEVDAHGLPSELLDRLNIIEYAVRAEVMDEVNRRLASGPIAAALNIDLRRIAEAARLAP
jgi:hypothetical protein